MFDEIIRFVREGWDNIKPFVIINQYEGGVQLRAGNHYKTIYKGIHFKIPFLDDILRDIIVPTTIPLPPQSLTTNDNKTIVIKAIIKYEVNDIKTFLLQVNDAIDAIADMTQGAIKDSVSSKTFDEAKNIDDEITKKSRTEAKKWGINIIKVTVTNYGLIRSIRLFNDAGTVT